jgi:hypothetical protein
MKMNHILPTARGAAPSTENEGAAWAREVVDNTI